MKDYSRYQRQTILPEIGLKGQTAFAQASVLLVGCGGLGCPALQYLVGAGVGHITIIDADVVERSNFHRQPLFSEIDIGEFKVNAAKQILNRLNPDVQIAAVNQNLIPSSASNWIKTHDIVLDCTDSFAIAYVLSDLCFKYKIPFIHASATQFEGYVAGYCAGSPSMRAVFPDMPSSSKNCAQAGVLGPVVGVIGVLQAQITLLVLLKDTPSPLGRMTKFDGRRLKFSCFDFHNADEPVGLLLKFIDVDFLANDDYVIELRDVEQAPQPITENARRLSLSEVENSLKNKAFNIPEHTKRIVLCCHSGIRAWRAARLVEANYPGKIALIAANFRST